MDLKGVSWSLDTFLKNLKKKVDTQKNQHLEPCENLWKLCMNPRSRNENKTKNY
jgi:hypothetical protein